MGLNQLLYRILRKRIRRLALTHKDRLLRFGSGLIFAMREIQSIEIVIIDAGERTSFEQELAQEVLEVVTMFSARPHGSRRRGNKQMLDGIAQAVLRRQADGAPGA